MANQRLDAAYAAQAKAIRARVERFTAARFAAGEYRDADLTRFVSQVSSVVLAGRQQTAALTDSYLTQVLKSSGVKVPAHKPVDTVALRGVAVAEVYARPYVTVRTKLSEGMAFDSAVRAGESRLTDLVATDMQLAKTYTAQNVFSRTGGVRGYARVVSGGKTCALCYIASTQKYHKEDLMPIHPGCSCGVEPITADNPWDQGTADKTLEDTHAAVFDRLGTADPGARDAGLGKTTSSGKSVSDYTDIVITRNHGEIGPVLGIRGQHFTSESGLPN